MIIYHYPRSGASEGYVFTSVCHSVNSGRRSAHLGGGGGGGCSPGGGGGSACQEGRTPVPSGRWTPPPPPGSREPGNTVNALAVRILLECILVILNHLVYDSIFTQSVAQVHYRHIPH